MSYILFNIFCLLFTIKNQVKVFVHINTIIPSINIYHIGVSFREKNNCLRYDIYNDKLTKYLSYLPLNDKNNETTIFWGYTNKTMEEIYEYENNLNYKYILGIQDCRHYSNNLTQWSMGKGTPIWNLSHLL